MTLDQTVFFWIGVAFTIIAPLYLACQIWNRRNGK